MSDFGTCIVHGKDIMGQQFGRLTVIGLSDNTWKDGKPLIRCKCDCGSVIETRYKYLLNGHKKSCGCFQKDSRHKKMRDLTGMRVGRLTVIRLDPTSVNDKRLKWICQCDCGQEVSVFGNNLTRHNTLSCGCLNRELSSERKFKDLVGQKFGRLTVIEVYDGSKKLRNPGTLWRCKCDCGKIAIVQTNNLLNGHTQSCGCLQIDRTTTHGLTRTKVGKHLCGIHGSMIRRCYNKNDKSYYRYGGRGIYICDDWYTPGSIEGTVNFYNWAIENGYEIGLSIDRINNDGPYAPWNCRWGDSYMQGNNKSTNNHIIDADGDKLSLAEFERKYHYDRGFVGHRLRKFTKNELVFSAQHPELGMCFRDGKVVDSEGFMHMIPRYDLRKGS